LLTTENPRFENYTTPQSILLDAGPLVAYLMEGDAFHDWAVQQFDRFSQFHTCEPVLAEACARLGYYRKEPANVLDMLHDLDWVLDFQVKPNASRIARLMRKYADQPMDLADACLVTMSEQLDDCLVLTLDDDFRVYRRHEQEPIPFVSPRS
jgi:uncharacterized protein